MLGFAPLSAVPISALPVAGSTFNVDSLGVISNFGTPFAIWDQFVDVSGFAPTQFGTPTVKLTQPVTGFSTTQFGTPAGYKLQRAQGFLATQFGTPYLHPSHVAPWPVSTAFGSPSGRQCWKIQSMGQVAKFGTPTTPTDRTGVVSGFAPVVFGTPVAVRHRPANTAIICSASGFAPVRFGVPAGHWSQVGAVQAIAPTVQFGTPKATMAQRVTGMAPAVQFGTPFVRTTQRASGFNPVAFGLARAILTQRVIGADPKVKFGTPKAVRSDWYEVRGFCPARFGTPAAFQRNNYRVQGFAPAQFGTPSAYQTHRVTSIPPIARFGKPLLRRTTQC